MRLKVLTVLLSIVVAAAGQPIGLTRDVLTNRGILTLASAGFSEEFILETIAISRTRFDVSIEGLAWLAKEGVNERIIRAMRNAQPLPDRPAPIPAVALYRHRPARLRQPVVPLAIASHTPYVETHSYLWGLIRKGVEVGVAPRGRDSLSPHLGVLYERVALPDAEVR